MFLKLNFMEKKMIKIKRNPLPVTHVLFSDRDLPEDEQTSFTIRKLTRAEDRDVRDKVIKVNYGSGGESTITGALSLGDHLLEAALEGWRNVTDADGGQVKFDKTRRAEMLALLPDEVVDELSKVYSDL